MLVIIIFVEYCGRSFGKSDKLGKRNNSEMGWKGKK